MKTLIVGGGKGCLAILQIMDAGHLRELAMDVVCVADIDPEAPAMRYARDQGLLTVTDFREAIVQSGAQLILELTGSHDLLDQIYHELPPGVRVIDHQSARIFWDLLKLERSLRNELKARAALEEALAADRQRAQDILDSLPDMVVVLAPDKSIRMTNRRFFLESGVDQEEALGKSCTETVCRDQPHFVDGGCPFELAVTLGQPVSAVVERQRPQQDFFEVTACPQYDDEGNLVEVVETHHPITKRIMLQREAEKSERLFRQFIASARDIISIKDRQGRYLVTNLASAELFGLEPRDCIGKTARELYSSVIAGKIEARDHLVMEAGEHLALNEVYSINGKDHHFETVCFPLIDFAGEIEGVCTIARNVTRRRQLQEQVNQSAKLAAVGKLAAGVAHEINNPLTGVLAYAEDLRDDAAPGDERRADYEVIIRETLRCRAIVRSLLDYSRQEEPVFQTGDLSDVVRKTVTLVEKLPNFRDVDLRVDLGRESLPVDADHRQLQQVLLNLIINALDAMDGDGTIAIQTGHEAGKAFASVSDSGPGIPDQEKSRIFEPFYTTKATTGLGLSVSWGIVERHRGTIELRDSRLGGACFSIVLPLVQAIRDG